MDFHGSDCDISKSFWFPSALTVNTTLPYFVVYHQSCGLFQCGDPHPNQGAVRFIDSVLLHGAQTFLMLHELSQEFL